MYPHVHGPPSICPSHNTGASSIICSVNFLHVLSATANLFLLAKLFLICLPTTLIIGFGVTPGRRKALATGAELKPSVATRAFPFVGSLRITTSSFGRLMLGIRTRWSVVTLQVWWVVRTPPSREVNELGLPSRSGRSLHKAPGCGTRLVENLVLGPTLIRLQVL